MAAEHPNGEQARGTGVGEACEFHCGPFTKEPPGGLVATAAGLGSILGLETEIPLQAAACWGQKKDGGGGGDPGVLCSKAPVGCSEGGLEAGRSIWDLFDHMLGRIGKAII